jgi:tRNA-specific adenosine deaminase 1
MDAQDDASPWSMPRDIEASDVITGALPGRAYFSQLGIVRRKPARGDAPVSSSKSCSDKLALKQCTSLLASITSLFVEPANAYIDTLVLPLSQHNATATQRAFSSNGRMSSLAQMTWPGGYSFRPFHVAGTDIEFAYSRRSVKAGASQMTPSNLAVLWTASGLEESTLGGVRLGRKASDVKAASRGSRRRCWLDARELTARIDQAPDPRHQCLAARTYNEVKSHELLTNRRDVEADVRSKVLKGWIRNEGDSGFTV